MSRPRKVLETDACEYATSTNTKSAASRAASGTFPIRQHDSPRELPNVSPAHVSDDVSTSVEDLRDQDHDCVDEMGVGRVWSDLEDVAATHQLIEVKVIADLLKSKRDLIKKKIVDTEKRIADADKQTADAEKTTAEAEVKLAVVERRIASAKKKIAESKKGVAGPETGGILAGKSMVECKTNMMELDETKE